MEGRAAVSGEVKKNILSEVKIENRHNKEVVSGLTDFTSPRTEPRVECHTKQHMLGEFGAHTVLQALATQIGKEF